VVELSWHACTGGGARRYSHRTGKMHADHPSGRQTTMSAQPDKSPLEEARECAELGLPLGRPTRFRFIKRMLVRLNWFSLSRQITVNHGLVDTLAALEERIDALRDHLGRAEGGMNERLDLGLRQAFQEIGDHIAQARFDQTALAQHVDRLESRIDQLESLRKESSEIYLAVKRFEESLRKETSEMHLARAEANIVIDRIRRALPEPIDLTTLQHTSSAWDDLYLPFESAFRGSSELIKSRLSIYLTDLHDIERGDRAVLDVGCGRGDWLALLSEEGIVAYGVDIDERSIEEARSNKLDARLADAFAHLAQVPVGSLAAITAFHLVEHLSTDDLVSLLDLCYRALMPGGLLILETPNPENLVVGITDFYLDPTHRNPIPPPLLAFLTGTRGFSDANIRRLRRGTLAPVPTSALATLDPALVPMIELLQDHLLAGEDYAVLARRI